MANAEEKTSIVILTGGELRHTYFRIGMAMQPGVRVLASFCEGAEKSLTAQYTNSGNYDEDIRASHIAGRLQTETDFFASAVKWSADKSNPVSINKGDINSPQIVKSIIGSDPDLLICYGSSLIRSELLDVFSGRFINAHLGLSPYYRGSGTNFWCLVNGEPECFGATFMYIDAGIDTGKIIHQIRGHMNPFDTPHQIGARLIKDMTEVYGRLVKQFKSLENMPKLREPESSRLYKEKDFSDAAVRQLHENFSDGMIPRYLSERPKRDKLFPVISNPALSRDQA